MPWPARAARHGRGAGAAPSWNEERRRLITQRLRAIVDGGQPDGAIGPLRQLTAGEPLAEPFWVLLVTALQRSGRQSEALRAAQEARAALAAVGLEPGAALRAAEAEALRNDERSRPDRGAASAQERRDDVRYAGGPGHQVAYTTFGDGDADIVVLNPAMLSIDALFDERRLAHGIRRLASTGRVAFFDRRGIGLSDPLEAGGDALDAWVDDLAAVLDALGARRSVLVANFDTGLIALEFAARHGERLAKLVLVHCFARFIRTDDYPYGLDPATASNLVDASTSTTAAGWNPLHLAAPSVADDPAFRAWWDRTGRRAASPATAAAILTTEAAADVRHRLSAITVRTLVLHRQACVGVDLGHAHYLAQHLPAAELRIVGRGHDSLWFTDHPALLDELVDYCGA
ncbi:MAG: BTAD domain-containing putative transcriptional regulator [Acidimicrobiales bacterium]